MSNPEDDFLRKEIAPLRTPPVDEERRRQALVLAVHALSSGLPKPARPLRPWMVLTGALGICIAAALILFRSPSASPKSSAPSGAMLAEMEQLFPQQLDGVIVNGPDVDVKVASDLVTNPADQRIGLTIEGEGHALQVLTYSGRRICVPLDGREYCLTPLLQGDGTVFVLTNAQVLRDGAALLPGRHIHMQHLPEAPSA